MITEDYVSFEVSKLLKEKGFDVECRAYWDSRIDDLPKEYEFICFTEDPIHQPYDNMHSIRKRYLAPTHQMAMKWLREVHNLYIEIFVTWRDKISHYQWRINNLITQDTIVDTPCLEKPEEAIEAALKYSLKNLI